MQIEFVSKAGSDIAALVVPVAKNGLPDVEIPVEQDELVRKSAERLKFGGGRGSMSGTYVEEGGNLLYVLLVGVGGKSDSDLARAGARIFERLKGHNVTTATLLAGKLEAEQAAWMAYGCLSRSWSIDKYKSKDDDDKVEFTKLEVVAADGADGHFETLDALAQGTAFTQELVAEPANILYPESFVERCQHLKELGVELTVLDEKQMEELGMGALLGVAQGSVRKPRLLAMRWNGRGDDSKPLVLVGKGVTFDTGGISIKPAAGMEDMKWDMGGAAVVAGSMKALAARKANAHVIGICGLVENMPDGNAQRPGDVVTTMSGQTVEVINTDAEGRLVLCDALHWAQKEYDPEYVVDFATLTGAIIVALGHEHAGLFTNDDGLADMLLDAGKVTGDKMWRLPLSKDYDKLIDSSIADMKNVGPRHAGSITAAQYLQRFILDGVKWAHCDIAGTAWSNKSGDLWEKGATGYGVRLVNRLVADNFEG